MHYYEYCHFYSLLTLRIVMMVCHGSLEICSYVITKLLWIRETNVCATKCSIFCNVCSIHSVILSASLCEICISMSLYMHIFCSLLCMKFLNGFPSLLLHIHQKSKHKLISLCSCVNTAYLTWLSRSASVN